MNSRHLAAWCSGVALVVIGTTFLSAQPPREAPARNGRDNLRAEIVKLRTEVEMLRFDYELVRDRLLEDLKLERGLKMAGGMIQVGTAIQSAINQASANAPPEAPRQPTREDKRKAAEAQKAAEEAEKKEAAEEAAAIAERKKELIRLFTLLSEKRLDLEDAERSYRDSHP